MRSVTVIALLILATQAATAELRYVEVAEKGGLVRSGWWDDATSILHLRENKRMWYPDRTKVEKVRPANAPADEPKPTKLDWKPAVETYGEVSFVDGSKLGQGWIATIGDAYVFVEDGNIFPVRSMNGGGRLVINEKIERKLKSDTFTEAAKSLAIVVWQ